MCTSWVIQSAAASFEDGASARLATSPNSTRSNAEQPRRVASSLVIAVSMRRSGREALLGNVVGAAAQLAVAVEPGVGSLHRPPAAGLDGCGLPLRRDVGLEAEELQ